MTTDALDTPSAAASVEAAAAATSTLRHGLIVPANVMKESTVMTNDGVDRVKDRIRSLGKQSPSPLVAAGFSFLAITASALVAYFALPWNVSLPPGSKAIMLTIVIAGGVITAGSFFLHWQRTRNLKSMAEDICDEIATYSYAMPAPKPDGSEQENGS